MSCVALSKREGLSDGKAMSRRTDTSAPPQLRTVSLSSSDDDRAMEALIADVAGYKDAREPVDGILEQG